MRKQDEQSSKNGAEDVNRQFTKLEVQTENKHSKMSNPIQEI